MKDYSLAGKVVSVWEGKQDDLLNLTYWADVEYWVGTGYQKIMTQIDFVTYQKHKNLLK